MRRPPPLPPSTSSTEGRLPAPPTSSTQVAVVIPAFEAAATVADVVSRARAALPDAQVFVVDDGSSDDTAARARAAGAEVTSHSRNRGKGAALATGLAAALASGARVVATLDADGQHAPALLPDLVAPVAAGEADLVLGARRRSGGREGGGGGMPWSRRLSNWLSAVLASRIGGVRVPDAQTGFRVMRRELAERIRPAGGGGRYEWELEFLLEALRTGYRVVSVPIPTVYDGAASHFRGVGDTWRVTRVFLRYSRYILFGAS